MSAFATANARLLALCGAAERPGALGALRRAGCEAFASAGLPDTHHEDWRYTNLAPLAALELALPGPPPAIPRARIEELATPVFACGLHVLANGRHARELDGLAARGAEVLSLREHPEAARGVGELVDLKAHPLAALATALADDGVVVRVPAGLALTDPIHLVFVSASAERPALSTPRVRIEAGRGSRVAIVQDHVSLAPSGAHFTNAVTEVAVGANARVELVVLQRENDDTLHAAHTAVRLAQGASFASHVVTLGGRLTRNDLTVVLAEEGAECALGGLYLGTGERLVDNHSLVDHAVPHCASRQLYKGVLGGSSQGVFRGRVIVRPGAQKTNASQSNPNLLLSDGAEIDTKPQLEIYADDVKCSHGSAIGRLDENALFYLRSRALGEREARALLTRGFAAEVLNALPGEPLRDALAAEFAARVAEEGGS